MRSSGRILGSYLVVFAILAAPWLVEAAHALPIESGWGRGDARLLTWILWWVAHSLSTNPAAILDAPINYPAPGQITGSEHFVALQLAFLPIYLVSHNPVLAINALLLFSYPLAAFAMNRLLAALGFAPVVAWVMGLAFALGPLQLPANVHMLHTLAFYPPAVALASHELRQRPGARATGLLALVLLIGFFSAYYTTAILLAVLVVWTVAELTRPLPGRWRFALTSALVALACLTLLTIASLPYLERGATVGGEQLQQLRLRQMTAGSSSYVTLAPIELFGAGTLTLAFAGCAGLALRRCRGVTILGLALVATSALLINGAPLALVSSLPWPALVAKLTGALSFFRVVLRHAAIGGLGFALLGAVALQWARDTLPRPAAIALLVVVVFGLLFERGGMLLHQALETPSALTADAPAYHEVARLVAREGRGAFLEIPVSSWGYSLQPEAMLGQMAHEQPLIVGHTGYLPQHRQRIDDDIARLPADDAVQDLVDRTRLRWLLVRPVSYWGREQTRARFVSDLTALRGVRRALDVDDWILFSIDRETVQHGLFEAIASGASADGPAAQPR